MKLQLLPLLILPLLLLSGGVTGCASQAQKNGTAFLTKVNGMNINANDVTQTTRGPFYNHSESVTGFTHTPQGFAVDKLSVNFNIPFPVLGVPLLEWTFTANSISAAKASDLQAAVPSAATDTIVPLKADAPSIMPNFSPVP